MIGFIVDQKNYTDDTEKATENWFCNKIAVQAKFCFKQTFIKGVGGGTGGGCHLIVFLSCAFVFVSSRSESLYLVD